MSFKDRSLTFCKRLGIHVPVLLAPMAGASAPSLSIAVINGGGLGGCGALLMQPEEILKWSATVRESSSDAFQLNLWVPDSQPARDERQERAIRSFLRNWGPEIPPGAGDSTPPDFAGQCEALLEAGPRAISSVMGLYPPKYVARLKERRILWFAVASTVKEATLAKAAGADVIVAQGMEAGGHRGSFEAANAERNLVGLFSLVPAIVDAVKVPVVATGGIADGVESPRPSRWAQAPYRSEPAFFVVRRLRFILHGQIGSVEQLLKKPSSVESSAGVRDEASRRSMFVRRWQRMLLYCTMTW